MDEGDEHAGIKLAGAQEELLVIDGRLYLLLRTAREHNLAEGALLKLCVEVGEVDGVVVFRGTRINDRGARCEVRGARIVNSRRLLH